MAVDLPDFLSLVPEREGYSLSPHDDNLRTDFDQGPARVRRRFTDSIAVFTMSFPLDAEEFSNFQAFYKNDLVQGTSWFNLPVYANDGYAIREARFASKYQAALFGATDWTVTANIELRTLPTFTGGQWYIIKLYAGDRARLQTDFIDRLDVIVNAEYPTLIGIFR